LKKKKKPQTKSIITGVDTAGHKLATRWRWTQQQRKSL